MIPTSTISNPSNVDTELCFQWLSTCIDYIPDSDIDLLLQAYMAITICHDIEEKTADKAIQILQLSTSRLHNMPEDIIRSSNSKLLAITAISYLKLFEIRIPSIDNYIQEMIDALYENSLDKSITARPLLVLSSALNLIPKPSFDIIDYEPNLSELLTANRCSSRNTVTKIENLTVHGVIPFSISHGVIEVLEVILIERLQCYDLEIALRLLRILNYLDYSKGFGFQQAFNFVSNHQHPDGYFGFFEPEIISLNTEFKLENIELRFKLQNTFSYLWLVAETIKSEYRLFGSIAKTFNGQNNSVHN